MEREQLEHHEFCVPVGEGYIVGDILRKYALRSVGTWQIIGYKLDSQVAGFGFSSGVMVSYLDLMKGHLVSSGKVADDGIKVLNFTWDGSNFVSEQFTIEGLSDAVGHRLVVAIAFGRGHHSAAQNMELLKQSAVGGSEGFFIIPSSHSEVSTFTYTVLPTSDDEEQLSVEADAGVTKKALDAVIETLMGLNI